MSKTHTRADDERLLEWLQLRDEGLTLKAISARTGASIGKIQGALFRLDKDMLEQPA